MTQAESLRQLADWIEANPEVEEHLDSEMRIYAFNTQEEAEQLWKSLPSPSTQETDCDTFYIQQTFGKVNLRAVLYTEDITNPGFFIP